MATVVAVDCDTAAKGYLVIDVNTENVPSFWTGVQGGGLPLDPDNPKDGEVEHRLANSGSLNTVSLNETDTAWVQEIISYEKYGNASMTTYRRTLGADPVIPAGVWSRWLKIG